MNQFSDSLIQNALRSFCNPDDIKILDNKFEDIIYNVLGLTLTKEEIQKNKTIWDFGNKAGYSDYPYHIRCEFIHPIYKFYFWFTLKKSNFSPILLECNLLSFKKFEYSQSFFKEIMPNNIEIKFDENMQIIKHTSRYETHFKRTEVLDAYSCLDLLIEYNHKTQKNSMELVFNKTYEIKDDSYEYSYFRRIKYIDPTSKMINLNTLFFLAIKYHDSYKTIKELFPYLDVEQMNTSEDCDAYHSLFCEKELNNNIETKRQLISMIII